LKDTGKGYSTNFGALVPGFPLSTELLSNAGQRRLRHNLNKVFNYSPKSMIARALLIIVALFVQFSTARYLRRDPTAAARFIGDARASQALQFVAKTMAQHYENVAQKIKDDPLVTAKPIKRANGQSSQAPSYKGYLIKNVKMNQDCSGPTAFTHGSKLHKCRTDNEDSAVYRSLSCNFMKGDGVVEYSSLFLNDPTCADVGATAAVSYPRCASEPGTAPHTASVSIAQCSADVEEYLSAPGFQIQKFNDRSSRCRGAPDEFSTVRLGTCIAQIESEVVKLNINYEDIGSGSSSSSSSSASAAAAASYSKGAAALPYLLRDLEDADLTREKEKGYTAVTEDLHSSSNIGGGAAAATHLDYSYFTYDSCSNEDGTMEVTEYADAHCTKPIHHGTVQIRGLFPSFNQCTAGAYQHYTAVCIN
jgi:hypothetical protein